MKTGTIARRERGRGRNAGGDERTITKRERGLERRREREREWRGEGGGEESSGFRHTRKEAEEKTRRCHSARGIISADRRWRLQVASGFGRMTRRQSDDVVPRGEPGTKDGRGETVTGTRTGAGTGTETRKERRVKGRESPGTYVVIVEVGRQDATGGERRQRVTKSHSSKTRRPSETVAPYGGP